MRLTGTAFAAGVALLALGGAAAACAKAEPIVSYRTPKEPGPPRAPQGQATPPEQPRGAADR